MGFGIPAIAAVPRPVLAAIVVAVGLSGAFLVYGSVVSSNQTVIPFHTIRAFGATGQSKPANLVINDNETWVPCDQAPFVNFTTRTLIVVFMGGQPGPLYGIRITQIVESGSSITVHVLWTKAGTCGEAAEVTFPSYLVDIAPLRPSPSGRR